MEFTIYQTGNKAIVYSTVRSQAPIQLRIGGKAPAHPILRPESQVGGMAVADILRNMLDSGQLEHLAPAVRRKISEYARAKEPKTERLLVCMTEAEKSKLQSMADVTGRSMSDILLDAIR